MLKTFAATYVALQENLINDEKISTIKWIQEADKDEIKSFLITGDYELQKEAVNVFDKSIFSLTELDVLSTFKGFVSADGRLFTGVVNVERMNQIIVDLVKKAGDAGEIEGVKLGIAASAIAALVLVIAHRAYKLYLSKAARSCSQYSGEMKTNCMAKYKRQATEKEIVDLRVGSKSCDESKNPEKCQAKVNTKIRKLQAKLGTL